MLTLGGDEIDDELNDDVGGIGDDLGFSYSTCCSVVWRAGGGLLYESLSV